MPSACVMPSDTQPKPTAPEVNTAHSGAQARAWTPTNLGSASIKPALRRARNPRFNPSRSVPWPTGTTTASGSTCMASIKFIGQGGHARKPKRQVCMAGVRLTLLHRAQRRFCHCGARAKDPDHLRPIGFHLRPLGAGGVIRDEDARRDPGPGRVGGEGSPGVPGGVFDCGSPRPSL